MNIDMRIVEFLGAPAEARTIERCAILSMPQYNAPATIISRVEQGELVTLVGHQLNDPSWLYVSPFSGIYGWLHTDSVLDPSAVRMALMRAKRKPIYIAGMRL